MKSTIKSSLCLLFIILQGLLASGCKDDEPVIKKDPVLVWDDPADITFGTVLSTNQLNATADVAGSFVYDPALGTSLSVGQNQDLSVDFTPADLETYSIASKTVSINVLPVETVVDVDGNSYQAVIIGPQVWMVQNLRTTKLNDDSPIPNVIDGTDWSEQTSPAYSWYENDAAANQEPYGALYNWYTVNTGKLCPTGWHVPTDAEWTILTDYLGGEDGAGYKMKEIGATHWGDNNGGSTNESGFTALPGGYREWVFGDFAGIGARGNWWTSTEELTETTAWDRQILDAIGNVDRYESWQKSGFSVRCVKD